MSRRRGRAGPLRRRLLASALAGTALSLAVATPVLAHPLGAFTVNTADRVQIVASGVRVLHVIDLAEIPTVQLAQPSAGVDTDRDGQLGGDELDRHAAAECARVRTQLTLTVDGAAVPLRLQTADGRSRPGQAPLTTVRVECSYLSGQRPSSSLSVTDAAAAARNGWSEITVVSSCGTLTGSTVPQRSPTALLTAYPQDLLSSPLRVTTASASVRPAGRCTDPVLDGEPAGGASTAARGQGVTGQVDRAAQAVSDLAARPGLTVGVVLAAGLLAVLFGAVHAMAPGHGKTVVAAYLVGQRGTRRQAVWLGAAVTAAHTGSVLALGALVASASLAAPELVLPYTQVISGLLLATLGGWLLLRAVRQASPRHHTHPHEHPGEHHGERHQHEHEHHDDLGDRRGRSVGRGQGHRRAPGATALQLDAAAPEQPAHPVEHDHAGRWHSHAPLTDAPLGWRSLLVMGVAGGLVPSPSALVVLLGANSLGRPWLGVLLVLCYGLGMAITLTAAGLVLLRARSLLARRGWALDRIGRLRQLLPMTTAAVVVLVGAVLVTRGLLDAHDLR